MNKTEIPDWVVYPQEKWVQITPAQAGFDAVKFNSIVGNSQVGGARWEGEVHKEKEWGAVLTPGWLLGVGLGKSDLQIPNSVCRQGIQSRTSWTCCGGRLNPAGRCDMENLDR